MLKATFVTAVAGPGDPVPASIRKLFRLITLVFVGGRPIGATSRRLGLIYAGALEFLWVHPRAALVLRKIAKGVCSILNNS